MAKKTSKKKRGAKKPREKIADLGHIVRWRFSVLPGL